MDDGDHTVDQRSLIENAVSIVYDLERTVLYLMPSTKFSYFLWYYRDRNHRNLQYLSNIN